MKTALIALLLVTIPMPVAAQSSAPTMTTPSQMGRWDEYRKRQERAKRQEELHAIGGDAANLAFAAKPANFSDATRRQMGFDYAACITDKHPALAREYVLTDPTRDYKDERFRVFSDYKCVPETLKTDFTFLRMHADGSVYNMAEALLKRDKPAIPADFASIPYLAHREPMKLENYKKSGKMSQQEYAKRVERSIGEHTMSRIGECVVRADTSNAKALLDTEIGGEAEKAAIQLLLPSVGKCIENGSIKIRPEQLRGTVAFNLFRLVSVQPAAEMVKPDA